MLKHLMGWRAALIFSLSTVALAAGSAPCTACTPGDEACPVVLKMKPGAKTITATGVVSGKRPNFYFRFDARAGQMLVIHTRGGGLKTGPGIPIAGPNGTQDAVDEDMPYRLPATGSYVITLHANTMSDGPFGRFVMRLKIE